MKTAWLVGLWFVLHSWSTQGQRLTTAQLTGNSSDSAAYYRQQGAAYWRAQDYEQAVAAFGKSVALNPKENGTLGYLFLNQWYDYPRAIRHFDAYDVLTPNFDDVYANSPVSYLRGLAYQKMGNHPKAIEEMSCGIDPIDLKYGSQWVNYRFFINRAVSYLALNQPEKALTDLGKAIQNFNRSALAQYYRGKALLALNQCMDAKIAFKDASFFMTALRVERGNEQEDEYNQVCEEQVDEALTELK